MSDLALSPLSHSVALEKTLNGRETLRFRLKLGGGELPVPIGGEVVLTLEDDDSVVWAGTVAEIEEDDAYEIGAHEGRFATYICTDYSGLCDRFIVAKAYEEATLEEIVQDLLDDYLAGEGVTLGAVSPGPIFSIVFNYRYLTDCLDELSVLSGFSWRIDQHKKLYFTERGALTAPFAITEGSRRYRSLTVRHNRGQYRNRQYVRAGQDLTDLLTEDFVGDGARRTFTLTYPVGQKPTILVNGTEQTVGILGIDSETDWYWNKGSNNVSQNALDPALSSADTVEVLYRGLFPILVVADSDSAIIDRKAVEGGTGVYEALEAAPDVQTADLAFEMANGLLRRHGRISTVITFETDEPGLEPGQLLVVDLPALGLSGEFLIDSVRGQDRGDYRLRYSVRALSGEEVGGWQAYFRQQAQSGRRVVVRENEVLLLARQFSDTASPVDAIVTSTYDSATDFVVGTAEVGFSQVV